MSTDGFSAFVGNVTPAVRRGLLELKRLIVGVDARLVIAETSVADHETRLDSAEGTITDHETRLDSAESSISNHETRLDAQEAAWTSFVPTLVGASGNPSFGDGSSVVGAYLQVGKTVMWRVVASAAGSGISAGSGAYSLAPPVAPSGSFQIVGHGWIFGTNGFKILTADGSTGRLLKAENGAALTNTDGISASGHVISLAGSYEAS